MTRHSKIGLIALVPDSWDGYWQPRHQVVSRLSDYFTCVWMPPAVEWRQALKAVARGRKRLGGRRVRPRLIDYRSDLWPPKFYRPGWLARASLRARFARARRLLAREGCTQTIVYIWRPQYGEALDLMEFDLSCYHIDDEYRFSAEEAPFDDAEKRLIQRVDHVFIHSPALMKKKGALNPNTSFAPNGVDYAAFSTAVPEPDDLAPIQRPRIGYCGIIKDQLDWPLISSLVAELPQCAFVFVGPINPGHPETVRSTRELSQRENVHFLGGKTVAELARYPQHFDVCIMPYKIDGYTRYINPLKFYEYLAGGRPIVSSRIESLLEFGGYLELCEDAADWRAAIDKSLGRGPNLPEQVARRQSLAEQYDWDHVVRRIAETMISRLH
jgi:glycosyltransferase involved in cell wall biosynthesis